MAKDVHATVTFNHVDGIGADGIVNTFTFNCIDDDIAGGLGDELQARLEDFYNNGHDTSAAIGTRMGSQVSRTVAPVLRLYDITAHVDGSDAGSPVSVRTMANLPAAADAEMLPTEIAAVLTFHSPYTTDPEFGAGTRPRARDRGRLYLGPWGKNNSVTGTAGRPVPSATLRAIVIDAAKALRDDPSLNRWSVWSRAAARTRSVSDLWIDDAWDVQRRRGEKALTRTTA